MAWVELESVVGSDGQVLGLEPELVDGSDELVQGLVAPELVDGSGGLGQELAGQEQVVESDGRVLELELPELE